MGLDLPESAVDQTISLTINAYQKSEPASITAAHPGFKPSMQLDLENGRPMELDPILGNIVRKSKEFGVHTPILDYGYALLRVQQNTILARRKQQS